MIEYIKHDMVQIISGFGKGLMGYIDEVQGTHYLVRVPSGGHCKYFKVREDDLKPLVTQDDQANWRAWDL